MKKILKFFFIFSGIILSLIIIFFTPKIFESINNSFELENNIEENFSNDIKKESFYSIESLRKNQYYSSIIIRKDLGKENNYHSYIVSYLSNGLIIYALMLIPEINKPKKGFPVVIINHGYIPFEKYSTIKSYRYISNYFAGKGFIVLKSDYRNHGLSEKGDRSYNDRLAYPVDIINLIEALPSIKDADLTNIFMIGHSLGGEVTLKSCLITNKIKAASLWGPVTEDFPENILFFIRKNDPLIASSIKYQIDKLYTKEEQESFSPLKFIKYLKTPIIIHHSKNDESVPYQWSLRLEEELKKYNIEYKFYTYENDNHNFSKGSIELVLKRDLDFFRSKIE